MANRTGKLPFQQSGLTADLAAAMEQALQSEDFDEAMDLLEDVVAEDPEPSADVLGALAMCVFEDALTVMVDEVIPCGERALQLLDRVRAAGAAAGDLKTYRAKIQRAVRAERKREQDVLDLLSQPLEELDLRQVADLAFALDDRGGAANHGRAAELFQLAAKMAPAKGKDPYYYLCRQGMSLAKARQWQGAMPLLWKMAHRELPVPDLISSFVQLAYSHLLDYATEHDERELYQDIWNEAVERVTAAGESFPVARPTQDAALRIALQWDLRSVAEHLLPIFREQRAPRTVSDEVRVLLAEAEQRFAQ